MNGQENLSAQEKEALRKGGMGEDIVIMSKQVGRRLQHRKQQWTTLPSTNPSTTCSTTPVRIMLIGGGGNGKSTLGNVLLGNSSFESSNKVVAVTDPCLEATGTFGEEKRDITVIDTLGYAFRDTNAIQEVVDKMATDIDVFILVINGSSMRSEDLGISRLYEKQVINDECIKQFMVVMTHSQTHYTSTGVQDFLKNIKENSYVNKFMTAINDRVVMVELGSGTFTADTALYQTAACEKELEQARDMVMTMVFNVMEENKQQDKDNRSDNTRF